MIKMKVFVILFLFNKIRKIKVTIERETEKLSKPAKKAG